MGPRLPFQSQQLLVFLGALEMMHHVCPAGTKYGPNETVQGLLAVKEEYEKGKREGEGGEKDFDCHLVFITVR